MIVFTCPNYAQSAMVRNLLDTLTCILMEEVRYQENFGEELCIKLAGIIPLTHVALLPPFREGRMFEGQHLCLSFVVLNGLRVIIATMSCASKSVHRASSILQHIE